MRTDVQYSIRNFDNDSTMLISKQDNIVLHSESTNIKVWSITSCFHDHHSTHLFAVSHCCREFVQTNSITWTDPWPGLHFVAKRFTITMGLSRNFDNDSSPMLISKLNNIVLHY